MNFLLIFTFYLFTLTQANNNDSSYEDDYEYMNNIDLNLNDTYIIAVGLCNYEFNDSNIAELDLLLDVEFESKNQYLFNNQTNLTQLVYNCFNQCCILDKGTFLK